MGEGYGREMSGLLGTTFVGIAINILTAETDAWWGPLQPITRYPYVWVPLSLALWAIWRFWRRWRTAVTWTSEESPYPGLAYFTEERSSVFFGRERETRELLHRLERSGTAPHQRVIAIVGPSGSGKSSLIRAGVLPRVPRRWRRIGPIRPDANPFLALAEALTDEPGDVSTTARLLRAEARNDSGSPSLLPRLLPGPAILVVDQLEDLYTATAAADRDAWWSLLARTLRARHELRILVAFRPEFRREVMEQKHRLVTAPFPVGPLDALRIRHAITAPAAAAGITFEGDLVDRMVVDATVGDALPLLGHLLQRLHQEATGNHITVQQYEHAGQVAGSIAAHAETVYSSLVEVFGEDLVDAVLLRGMGREGDQSVRRAIWRSALSDDERQIVEVFRDARLVVDIKDGTALEFAHDALFRHWERLTTLVNAHAEQLRLITQLEQRAAMWQFQPRSDDLLRGESLASARKLAEKCTLSHATALLIEASHAADLTERAKRSERLAASAQQFQHQEPELAKALLHALITEVADTEAARLSLWALTAVPDQRHLPIGHTVTVTSATWLPDGRRWRTADETARICTWNRNGDLEEVVHGTATGIAGTSILSRDGSYALTQNGRRSVLWRVADGRRLGTRRSDGFAPGAVSWGTDGRFAGRFTHGATDVYQLIDGKPEHLFSVERTDAVAMSWSPKGDRLAVVTDEGLAVFAMGTTAEEVFRHATRWQSPGLTWAPDGMRLAVSASLSPQRGSALVLDPERMLLVFDTFTGVMSDHSRSWAGEAIAWSPKEDVIAFGTGRIRHMPRMGLLDVTSARTVHRRARPRALDIITWSRDGATIGSAAGLGNTELLDLQERRFRRLPSGKLRRVSWAPAGKRLVIGRLGVSPQVISMTSPTGSRTLPTGCVHEGSWSALGNLIAISEGPQVIVCDEATGSVRSEFGGSLAVTDLQWCPEETRIVTLSGDFWERVPPALTVWDVQERRSVAELEAAEKITGCARWAPDGTFLAAADGPGFTLWDGRDYRLAHRCGGESDTPVRTLAWSPNSPRLAVARGRQIEIWSVAEPRLESRCFAHSGDVKLIRWSPDGTKLAGLAGDELFLWRVSDGLPLGVITYPGSQALAITWRDTLDLTSQDGTVWNWTVPGHEGTPHLPEEDVRPLSADERRRYGLAV